jgi:hypothetical protein
MPHPAFRRTDHRPWPCPARPWYVRQAWCDLLFAHWPVPRAVLRPLVPAALEIQEFDGTSWVGVVPFRMVDVGPRLTPNLFSLPAFPEVNLRLYVEAGGKPGVWFLSLDATNSLVVWAARRLFHLPYFKAQISLLETPGGFSCHSTRAAPGTDARLAVDYAPTGEVYEAAAGSLEHWLTERYCLYAQTPAGRITRTQVHHRPWPLQPARATFTQSRLADEHGFELTGEPAHLHFSRRIDVVAWTPELLPS